MVNRRSRKKNASHLKVADVRQTRANGSVAQIHAMRPAEPDTAEITLTTPHRVRNLYYDRDVEDAIAFVTKTGIARYVDDSYNAAKVKTGRPSLLTTFAVLVAMRLATLDNTALLLVDIRDVLFRRINPPMRRLLDLPDRPAPTPHSPAELVWEEATYALVRRTFHRMLAPIDPSVMPKNRKHLCDQVDALKKSLTPSEQQTRATALDWACGQLLEAAEQQLPQEVTTRHANKQPSYCIDGTPLPLFAKGAGLKEDHISADPDGGWYIRTGDHADPADTNRNTHGASPDDTSNSEKVEALTKKVWARDIHLLTTADASHPDRLYMPAIPVSMTTDIPGMDPAGAARSLFADMAARGHTPGYLAGDILYTNQDHLKFQTPARDAGYDLVLGYGVTQIGYQGSHDSGMHLVEGTYYAPCMPTDLATAVEDFRAKRIDLRQFNERIRARVQFKMRTKEIADPDRNVKERLNCPAAGPNPVAVCALKPKSQKDRPTRQPDGATVDLRPTIDHRKVLTKGAAPKVCAQETVTLLPTDGAKFRQNLAFGSPEHTEVYYRLRESQEGVHGTAKDEATIALANPGRRRVRGWAAQQLFAAFLFAETATRRIITFLRNAVRDHNGDLYVIRKKVKNTSGDPDHPTSGSPPGAPAVVEDDEDDGEAAA